MIHSFFFGKILRDSIRSIDSNIYYFYNVSIHRNKDSATDKSLNLIGDLYVI